MARRHAQLRLHKTLLARRADLCKIMADELANLREFNAADSPGDSADMAFEAGSDEISSQLEKLEALELDQIEWALARLKEGKYGICEGNSENCRKEISVSRLDALPHTTLCINCEREMENAPDRQRRHGTGNGQRAVDVEAFTGPRVMGGVAVEQAPDDSTARRVERLRSRSRCMASPG